ncbi:PDC sensor domain-containing protein [Paracoccus mutanolyticus]|uniref:hypothetical protein n=1 Tax=Paracoccus mutanolyticus TaxID=1499308 RepID=UPI001CB94A39|nr:hypothetical protein [Paracoccus mutanolyticus]
MVFALARRNALADMAQSRQGELQTRVQALESVLSRQRAVATVLADDALVRTALEQPIGPYRDRVSAKLDRLRDETDSAVIYLLDRAGIAIAAANWDEAQSFVGQDYSFRDYFSQALRQGRATQFALGTVSNRPGLYLSHDVVSGDRDLGVVVVKVEFDALEANWAAGPGLTLVLDAQGTDHPVRAAGPALFPPGARSEDRVQQRAGSRDRLDHDHRRARRAGEFRGGAGCGHGGLRADAALCGGGACAAGAPAGAGPGRGRAPLSRRSGARGAGPLSAR